MSYENATGGATDLDNLGQIMNQTNPPMEGKEQQSQARQDRRENHGSAVSGLFLSVLDQEVALPRLSLGRSSYDSSTTAARGETTSSLAESVFLYVFAGVVLYSNGADLKPVVCVPLPPEYCNTLLYPRCLGGGCRESGEDGRVHSIPASRLATTLSTSGVIAEAWGHRSVADAHRVILLL